MKKRFLITVIVVLLMFGVVGVVLADDLIPHRVHARVVNLDGDPVYVTQMGCDWSDYPAPTEYGSISMCTDCAETLCVFESMNEVEGAYIVAGPGQPFHSLDQEPDSAVWGQYLVNGNMHTFGMWYTNEGGPDNDWNAIHEITFTINLTTTAPTPTPTVTPIPTMAPPSAVDLSEGFDAGFDDTYGTLSGEGVLPPFSFDESQWLFYARKIINIVNQGNLLYVIGGILLAILVLGWMIEQVKNPR